MSRGGEAPSPPLPFPPPEVCALVDPTGEALFDNRRGALVYSYLAPEQYRRVFGCGCGRVVRQLILQSPRPEQYVGIDLHRGMIEWARANLTSAAPAFELHHHNVYNRSFNPGQGLPEVAPFPVETFTLLHAISVFTHLIERQAIRYMHEAARSLEPGGVIHASFFLIDKTHFPTMMEYSSALYLSYEDPPAAVLDDREWVCRVAAHAGLTVTSVIPPRVRNHQWVLMFSHYRPGLEPATFPKAEAPVEKVMTPPMPVDAHLIGLSGQSER